MTAKLKVTFDNLNRYARRIWVSFNHEVVLLILARRENRVKMIECSGLVSVIISKPSL